MKKIVGILSILGLTLIGFTNAEYMTGQNGMYIFDVNQPTVLGNYTFEFSNNGNLSTTLNNDNGNFIFQALSNSPYTLWNFYGWHNGKLYYYAKTSYNNTITQGYINKWCVGESYDYCKNGNYNYDTQYVIDHIGNISKVLYGTISLTWGSIGGDNFNSYVCFYDGTYYCASCNKSNTSSSPCLSGLTGNSLNLNESSIDGFNNTQRTQSPFRQQTTPSTPTNFSCPTIQQLINTYGNEYNTGLCYSSNLIYSGGTIETITPKNIFELYPTYQNYIQDVNLYNNYCVGPNTTTACQTAFNNRNIEYTLISKTTQTNRAKLYGYCNLQLNYEDKNATTCVTSGNINDNVTIEDIMNEITEEEWEVITPGTPPESEGTGNDTGVGSVFDSLGIGNEEDGEARRNVIAKAQNAIKSMKSIYTKLTGIFRARAGQNGIIPEYITGLLLIIVLYKIFKK